MVVHRRMWQWCTTLPCQNENAIKREGKKGKREWGNFQSFNAAALVALEMCFERIKGRLSRSIPCTSIYPNGWNYFWLFVRLRHNDTGMFQIKQPHLLYANPISTSCISFFSFIIFPFLTRYTSLSDKKKKKRLRTCDISSAIQSTRVGGA